MSVPGWEGSVGPFTNEYSKPHVYARDVQSGAGNCVCAHPLTDARHVQAAPGVPIPDSMRSAGSRSTVTLNIQPKEPESRVVFVTDPRMPA